MVKKAKKTKTMTKMVRMGSHQDENGMAQARAGKGGKTFGRFMASLLAFSLGVAALAPALSAPSPGSRSSAGADTGPGPGAYPAVQPSARRGPRADSAADGGDVRPQ